MVLSSYCLTRPDEIKRMLETRSALATAAGAGGSWEAFQTSVVVAAPLLTALVGLSAWQLATSNDSPRTAEVAGVSVKFLAYMLRRP